MHHFEQPAPARASDSSVPSEDRLALAAYPDIDAFLQAAQAFLENEEALNNLVLGTALRLRHSAGPVPYCAAVDNADALVATALLTSYGLALAGRSTAGPGAIDHIVQDLHMRRLDVPRVTGPSLLSRCFAEQWASVTGAAMRPGMRSRAWVLYQVIPPDARPGLLRRATEDDTDLVAAWLWAFEAEALGGSTVRAEAYVGAQRRIAGQEIFLWEDGQPVAMAGTTRPTPNGIGINAVYTPPIFRGHGYATACVAALSQYMLDAGRRFCTLFTDRTNPVSNAIYQKIGYLPVANFEEYHFIIE